MGTRDARACAVAIGRRDRQMARASSDSRGCRVGRHGAECRFRLGRPAAAGQPVAGGGAAGGRGRESRSAWIFAQRDECEGCRQRGGPDGGSFRARGAAGSRRRSTVSTGGSAGGGAVENHAHPGGLGGFDATAEPEARGGAARGEGGGERQHDTGSDRNGAYAADRRARRVDWRRCAVHQAGARRRSCYGVRLRLVFAAGGACGKG